MQDQKIKSIKKIEIDSVIYIDTDSCFFSIEPNVRKRFPNLDWTDSLNVSACILSVTKDIQNFTNKKMDYFAKQFLNLSTHKFYMKQELIADSAFWTAKKRYALNVINKEGLPVNEMEVKGLDVIRTSFPKVFREFMTEILKDILSNVDKTIIDDKITKIKSQLETYTISDLARPTGVKDISKHYSGKDQIFNTNLKSVPVHVKAAIAHNDLIRYNQLENNYALISDGEKVKWLYLKNNPYKLESMAFRDNGEDPVEVLEYITKYINLDKVYESELVGKLEDFYRALQWGALPTDINDNFSKFF